MTQAFDKDYWESHWQQTNGHAPGREMVTAASITVGLDVAQWGILTADEPIRALT